MIFLSWCTRSRNWRLKVGLGLSQCNAHKWELFTWGPIGPCWILESHTGRSWRETLCVFSYENMTIIWRRRRKNTDKDTLFHTQQSHFILSTSSSLKIMDDFPCQVCLIKQDNEVYGTVAKHVKTGYKALECPSSLLPTPCPHLACLAWWWGGNSTSTAERYHVNKWEFC